MKRVSQVVLRPPSLTLRAMQLREKSIVLNVLMDSAYGGGAASDPSRGRWRDAASVIALRRASRSEYRVTRRRAW
jgi:hypothetical protein